MKARSSSLCLIFLLCAFVPRLFASAYEVTYTDVFNIHNSILDACISNDKKIALLTRDKVVFFEANNPVDFIVKDKIYDKMLCQENRILLIASEIGKVQTVELQTINNIVIDSSPSLGHGSKVVIAIYSDYECPYCGRLEPLLQQVLDKYPNDVKVVAKNFPLNFHKNARKAATAALAAHDQGRFWDFHAKLFENLSSLSDEKIQSIAQELQLDMPRFNNKIKDIKIQQFIDRDIEEGRRIGVQGTPSIFINGKPLKDRSLQGFQKMIDAELKK